MGRGTSNVKSGDLPLQGGVWVVVLAALLLVGLGAAARLMRYDHERHARLDASVRSTEPLPTPPPVNNEEMDPDKE